MEINNRKNSTYLVIGVALVFVVILLFQFFQDPNENYSIEVIESRKQRDLNLTNDPQTLPDSLKPYFAGLEYYPPDIEYRVVAKFIRNPGNEMMVVETTKGKFEEYAKVGFIEFELQGRTFRLVAFREGKGSNRDIFIPFHDQTNDVETYHFRYMRAKLTKTVAHIDFNYCYNPTCVYNSEYSCPVPPEENKIDLAIEAGEKMFKWKAG